MMRKHTLQKFTSRTKQLVRINAPTLLTFTSIAGMIGTAILSAKATPKAIELVEEAEEEKNEPLTKIEIIAAGAKAYIPAMAVGISTIICILGANILSKRKQAQLTSAYALLNNYHRQYRNKLIELHGEEIDEEVRCALIRENATVHQIGIDYPDRKILFYDEISGETFKRYEREVMDAEYHTNRNFVLRGYAYLNEFYDFLGLPKTKDGERLGWTTTDGYYWIDFEHRLLTRDDGGDNIYLISLGYISDTFLEQWE